MKEAIAAARREAADRAPHNGHSGPPRRPRGRPSKPGSRRDVARRIGISPREQLRIERHVALGTQYPLFQNARWTRAHALKARSLLEALTDDQRLKVISQLAELDPRSALRLLQGLLNQPGGLVPVPAPTAPLAHGPG